MKVLITGGTGFSGSRLAEHLLAKGFEITILDNQKGLFYSSLAQKTKIILASVTDREAVRESLDGVEGVFHLAAAFRKINVPNKVYWDVNVEGTRILCEESLKHPLKKFVYCSTQGVHGDIHNPPGDENSPVLPVDYYQYTKFEGEKVVKIFSEKGLPSVILRPMGIYGPGDPARFLMLFRQVQKGFFPMFGSGNVFFHPLYVDNLNDSFVNAFESDKIHAEEYLIGDEQYLTIKELVKKVGESMGIQVKIIHLPFLPVYLTACLCEFACMPFRIPPPIFRRRVDWYRQNRAFKIDKAKNELHYQPKINLEEGLKRTAQWYKENGFIKSF
ncbi:MAG: NAD(P)-dependent oxidoreductase [Candidatus Aureabacteria bacterium]|nr:NAD(P)-dependent oxidoreductase [Candidatus Auribacterota bacterium]